MNKGIEIKKKIDFNNKLIEESLNHNLWTLNNTVNELLKENAKLQDQCEHEFKDGFCIYCYKSEEK